MRRRVAVVVTVALPAAAPALAQLKQAGARLWPIEGAVVSSDDEGADELLGMSDRGSCAWTRAPTSLASSISAGTFRLQGG